MKSWVALLPFAIGAVPVLSLWADNAGRVAPGVALTLLVIVWLGCGATLAALRLLLGDLTRASLVAYVAVLVFFLHGALDTWLWNRGVFPTQAGVDVAVLALDVALVGAAGFGVARVRANLAPACWLLALAAASSLAASGATLARSGSAEGAPTAPLLSAPLADLDPEIPAPRARAVPASAPDVYYIVLDGYARADVLEDLFCHDNTGFLDALEDRGFYVADRSTANYTRTHLSLASTLNTTYLDDLARHLGPDSRTHLPTYEMIQRNRVGQFVRARGYRYAQLYTNWGGTETSAIADVAYAYQPAWLGSEFARELARATPLKIFQPSIAAYHRFGLAAIPRAAELDGPTFLLAHLLLPHDPFVFDRDGRELANVPARWIADQEVRRRLGRGDERAQYIEQLLFLNRRLLEIVDEILAASETPPVIVLQGDHGWQLRAEDPAPCPGSDRVPARVDPRLPILNAYLVPEPVRRRLYPSITPVNTFRLLLTELFGARLRLLPDRSYSSAYRTPWALIDRTADLAAEARARETGVPPPAPARSGPDAG